MNSKGSDILLQASSECKFRLVRTVVEGGTPVDIRGKNRQTPLMLACRYSIKREKERGENRKKGEREERKEGREEGGGR